MIFKTFFKKDINIFCHIVKTMEEIKFQEAFL